MATNSISSRSRIKANIFFQSEYNFGEAFLIYLKRDQAKKEGKAGGGLLPLYPVFLFEKK